MRLVSLTLAGSGGRRVHISPQHVVALVEMGDGRTHIITTGLQGTAAMTLTVEEDPDLVAERLVGTHSGARAELRDVSRAESARLTAVRGG